MSIRPDDFRYISSIVKDEIGIVLEGGKEYLVESRLMPIAQSEGYGSLEALVGAAKSGTNKALKQKLLEAMTTNETLFFRDGKPFDALRCDILPALIDARRQMRSLTIWCAACSSGQEPYSICMLIREHFPELSSWNIKIKATDISSEPLAKAREGIYTQFEVNRGLAAPLLMKYFTRVGMKWQVKEDLRSMVEFSTLNLLDSWAVIPRCDIVLMRNVLIYFDEQTKRIIFGKVFEKVVPDGYYFVGGSETIGSLDSRFIREVYQGAQVYRVARA
jgi:chemotaxis protein methyltransferase CheR